jgi:hypothetical protein
MQFLRIRALVALVTATFVLALPAFVQAATGHSRHTPRSSRPKLPADYTTWSRVAGCETGGWRVLGYGYPDSLGIDRTNFIAFGGTPLPPGPVSRANQIMQIRVADKLTARYHIAAPDRYRCAAW